MTDLAPGDVVWVSPDVTVGREQAGRRPAVIVAGRTYLEVVDTLAVVVPITTVHRGWPNHVAVGAALKQPSWAMTEQVRTVSRRRITSYAGATSPGTLADIRRWISDFLEL
ncbi:MAG: type II toxin-antitoxin system PemK/MazF family toxin [Marmoricola sp.]